MKTIGGIGARLATPSDITVEAYLEMEKLLRGETPLLLGCATKGMMYPSFEKWLRQNRPTVAIVLLPEPILSHPMTWFIAGTTIVAFSQWGPK